ncbi:FAD-dependent oxidoreductase [Marivita sp. XM-24bin2]|jgi:predicted NAD/FAD-binding protein|uniref:NAD(P)/FAD-dependent oxidoreductase n=1 Tax=unclassified Marivita TaxID=2632480 RepID=UPI000D7A341C|nr:FAD-dependent oxidoreductase [Marivita sp. XM-24bin2]MCR9108449.1 FAD-dependent oxidoreductase [Paracoccaceae bacterium]PWL34398.1 MAG: cyclopropane-fatty-acyl-phospholipid synthase [Marivita sp. XM-24bin2]
MPFEARSSAPKKIAVIGAGISGMGAAHMLSEDHHVTLYEAEPRLGGHARTIMAGKNGDQPVDTGFIVFNYANYPHLARLFKALHVPVTKSNMSFGASLDGGRIEYALATVGSVFAQKKNLVNPKFLRMLTDIAKFNKRALDATRDRSLSLGDFLEQIGTGEWFREYYLLPLTGAIWSTPTEKIMDFPAHALVQFMDNHALLSASGQHQWYTVEGGSIEYVRRLESSMTERGVTLRLGAPIDAVRRDVLGAEIKAQGGEWERFDEVVFATHSDDTLRLLSDATPVEKRALGAIKYQPNRVVLHADASIMPKKRICWSSWNYTESAAKELNTIDLTYWMNSLQPIPENDPHFVTLNTTRPIREELIYDECTLRHPVYDLAALAAQDTVRDMNGTNRTWFCGAWMKNGFHEDGIGSAVDVVDAIRARSAVAVAAE